MNARAASAWVVAAFDTQAPELDPIAGLLRAAGVPVCTVGIGTRSAPGVADIAATAVAACHPLGAGAVFDTACRGAAATAIGEQLNRASAPVRLLLPLLGLSMPGGPGQAFHSPQVDAALFDTLRQHFVQSPGLSGASRDRRCPDSFGSSRHFFVETPCSRSEPRQWRTSGWRPWMTGRRSGVAAMRRCVTSAGSAGVAPVGLDVNRVVTLCAVVHCGVHPWRITARSSARH